MIRKLIRAAVLVAVTVGSLAVVTATPAQAIPPVGPNQSVTYTFYGDAAKTIEVGWWSYGSCGEPFDFGTHTQYFRIRYVTCTIG